MLITIISGRDILPTGLTQPASNVYDGSAKDEVVERVECSTLKHKSCVAPTEGNHLTHMLTQ